MSDDNISLVIEGFLMRGGSEAMREKSEINVLVSLASHRYNRMQEHLPVWIGVSRAIGPIERFLSCYVIEPYRARRELRRRQLSNIEDKRETSSRRECYTEERYKFIALYGRFISIEEDYDRTQIINLMFISVYAILQLQYYQRLELVKQCISMNMRRVLSFKHQNDVSIKKRMDTPLESGKEKDSTELMHLVLSVYDPIIEERLVLDGIIDDENSARYDLWTMYMASTTIKLIQELSFHEYMRRSQIGRNLIKWYDRQREDFKQKCL